jgi:predicted MFS family arabinose efflux permease
MTWSWTLLGWGALIGISGVLGSYLVGRRAHLDSNRWTAYWGFVVVSAVVAVVAASLDRTWPLIVFGGYVVLVNFAIPLALLTRPRQAAPHSYSSATDSCNADACAACPLARSQVT